MTGTKIAWAEAVWNPVTGCTKISSGCKFCYAEKMANRLKGRFGYPANKAFKVTAHADKFKQPLGWKKPRKIFVCSMGDLFHEDVSDERILGIYNVIYDSPQHVFMLLTKRPERMEHFHRMNVDDCWSGIKRLSPRTRM